MVSRLVIGGARASYVADCCKFYGAYCGACCGLWCCFRQILVFVDNHIVLYPTGMVADVGERDMGMFSSLANTDNGGVELAVRQQQPQHYTQTSELPAAWAQPAPQQHPHIVPLALPSDADDFLRVIPSLQASQRGSQILEGMRNHRSNRQVQERACRALMEMTPQVAGEEYARIKREAGQDWIRLMNRYTTMTQRGVVGAIICAMSEHPQSNSIAFYTCSMISFLARADACRDFIAREVNADGQDTCTCLILAMRKHETDAAMIAWACRALDNMANSHLGNIQLIVQAGGPSAILTAMHRTPFNHQLSACACQALSTLVTSRPFAANYIIDQQAVQTFLDVMQRHVGASASDPSEQFCVECACESLYKFATTHRNLLEYLRDAGAKQCLTNTLTLPSASARVRELAPKLLDLLNGVDECTPSAPPLPAQFSASASLVVDSCLVFENAPGRAVFCGKCGEAISADNSFCTKCGALVKEGGEMGWMNGGRQTGRQMGASPPSL